MKLKALQLTRRSSLGAIVSVALATLGASAPAWAQEYSLRMQANTGPGLTPYIALEEFTENVKAMSGGRVEIQLFPVSALFPPNEGLEAVATGIVELGLTTGGYFAGQMGPIATMESGLPGAEANPWERNAFFYEKGFINIVREAYGEHGVHYLAPNLGSPWELVSKVPLNSAADFEGKKIRGFGIEAEWWSALGAEPVNVGGAEIYTALATGVVDAVRWGDESQNLAQGLQEIAKYYIKPAPMPAPNNHILVNQATWDSMPADLQAIMEGAAKLASMKYLTLTALSRGPARAELEAAGMEFTTIPSDEWLAMQQEVRAIWAKYGEQDERAAEAVALLQEFLKELGR